MRLNKGQKEQVLEWIAQGLDTGEINDLATEERPPFAVSRSQVDYYRQSREVKIETIRAQGEHSALTNGLALKEVRVGKLQELFDALWQDLEQGRWVSNVKSIGPKGESQIIPYEEFNGALVQQIRGVLDDAAHEMGERRQVGTQVNLDWSSLSDEQVERIAAGEDPLKVVSKS